MKKMSAQTRKLITIILKGSAIIIPLVLVGILYWAASEQTKDQWLITSHFDPTKAGMFASGQSDSWAVVLANPQFASLSDADRMKVAHNAADELWKLAKESGYSKAKLYRWFDDTAKRYASYPVKTITLAFGQSLAYRDLSSSGIPKPSKLLALSGIFSINASAAIWIIVAIIAISVLVVVGLSLIIGTTGMFLSKDISLFFKIILAGLLVTAVLGGWGIKRLNTKKVIGGVFFNVSKMRDNYVYAEGSWEGVTEKIAYPVNAVKIECFKDEGICREINANLRDEALMVETETWAITNWDDKEVTVEEESPCGVTKMIINYKDKAVTQVQTRKNPPPVDCGSVNGGTFILRMVKGINVAYPKLKENKN